MDKEFRNKVRFLMKISLKHFGYQISLKNGLRAEKNINRLLLQLEVSFVHASMNSPLLYTEANKK